MNDLEAYFNNNQGRVIHKWKHYFDVYDRHFKKYRNLKTEVVILEIGVSFGGSLQMWKSYFGDNVKIYGIDVNPECKKLETEDIKIFIGSQSDRDFLRKIKAKIPPIDILIDDGGHTMKQQIVTFEEMFDHIKTDGVYLCEDIHTSYWLKFGGGYKRRGTFIEYSKKFIDYINSWHSEQRTLKVNNFTKTVASLHYYDSILVIEKQKMIPPSEHRSGKREFEFSSPKLNFFQKAIKKIERHSLYFINSLLRILRLPSIKW